MAKLFRERGIQMPRTLEISNWYLGFNWWDPVVGKGKTPEEQERNRKLRQALSIAIDWEEFVRVFESKAAGEPAMSAVPPGVFAYRPEAVNRTVYDVVDGKPRRKSIEEAKKLLAEAGYPDGRDAKTGQPLVLNYDYQRALTPELKAEVEWMVKQFAKIGVQLELRATDYNRFQDKADKGSLQIFWWGWFADYPDAENFLFLLYGPNSQALTQGNGNNTANYQDPEFDKLFEELRYLDDVPRKQQVVDQMVEDPAARRALGLRLQPVRGLGASRAGSATSSRPHWRQRPADVFQGRSRNCVLPRSPSGTGRSGGRSP